MNTRLKTSLKTEEYLNELHGSLQLSTKAAIARIAVAFSLQDPEDPMTNMELVTSDTQGFEFQRHTLTGDEDILIKALITQHAGYPITDEHYYPKMLFLHIERGMKYLYNEYKYQGNKDKFLDFIFKELY